MPGAIGGVWDEPSRRTDARTAISRGPPASSGRSVRAARGREGRGRRRAKAWSRRSMCGRGCRCRGSTTGDGRLCRARRRPRRRHRRPPDRAPMAADIPCRTPPTGTLEPGTVHRIMTGAPPPDGCRRGGAGRADRERFGEGRFATAPARHARDPVHRTHPRRQKYPRRRFGHQVKWLFERRTRLRAPQLGLLAAIGDHGRCVATTTRRRALNRSGTGHARQSLRHGQIYEIQLPDAGGRRDRGQGIGPVGALRPRRRRRLSGPDRRDRRGCRPHHHPAGSAPAPSRWSGTHSTATGGVSS